MIINNQNLIDSFYYYLKHWLVNSPSTGLNTVKIHEKIISMKSITGSKRKSNEDKAVFVSINNHIYNHKNLAIGILADGMGGMSDGNLAAAATIASFISYFALESHEKGILEASKKAAIFSNNMVSSLLKGKGGATLSAIIYGEKGCVGVNVGDSRIYYFDSKKLFQLSKDDTIHGQLSNSFEEDWDRPQNADNRLAQFIGTLDEFSPNIINLSQYSQKIGDSVYIITSDGAHYIGKKMLEKIIRNSPSNEKIAERIVNISKWLSGHDNSTIMVCPNKITVNKLKSEIPDERAELIKISGVSQETAYLIPFQSQINKKFENPIEEKNLKNEYINEIKPLKEADHKESKPSPSHKKNEDKKIKDKNAIIDMIPPEKKG